MQRIPHRRARRQVKGVRVQLIKGHSGFPDGPAHRQRPGVVRLLALQFGQPAGQNVGQSLGPGLHRPQLLQAEPQLPQQPDAPQRGQVSVGIVPVAVGLPGGGDKALRS